MGGEKQKRFITMLLGIMGMGITLSFLLGTGYGTDTSTFMNTSLAAYLGLSFGTVMVCTNAIFFIPEIIWGRKLIGPGTIFNMTLIGYTSDFCTMLERKYLPEEMFTLQPYRTITFTVSLILFLFFVALYMNSDMGLAPFDSIATIVASASKIPFLIVRMLWDFLVILIGITAGGKLTIATVILAFTIGPAVSWIGKGIKRISGV